MPTFIVKPKPDEDFYVAWSTIVDAPMEWGDRACFAHEPQERASTAPTMQERRWAAH